MIQSFTIRQKCQTIVRFHEISHGVNTPWHPHDFMAFSESVQKKDFTKVESQPKFEGRRRLWAPTKLKVF
jgi:hypothetical protein